MVECEKYTKQNFQPTYALYCEVRRHENSLTNFYFDTHTDGSVSMRRSAKTFDLFLLLI